MIVIVDYGMGNLKSIQNMIKKSGTSSLISSSIHDIELAEKLILPGVGAFDSGMKNLKERELKSILDEKVLKNKTPILGICLGMQLFARQSEEGESKGLGYLDAETVRFKTDNHKLKVPHMGWNSLAIKKNHQLLQGFDEPPRFYFVHSFHLSCQPEDILATTEHGYDFVSVVVHDNVMGVQFHPEKSHSYGMKLLKNFVNYAGN